MPRGNQRLAGKVAIVTGAGSSGPGVGTGKAMSILFAREGAKVALVDQAPERAEATLAEVRDEAGDAFVVQADVTRSGDCLRVVEAVAERYGRLDILVNNVGIAAGGPVTEVSEEDWRRVFDVNLTSFMLMSKHAIPKMIQGGGGAIVNLSSIAGLRGFGGSAYGASKGAVIALTRDMAVAYGRDGIRANCITPGHLYTPMVGGISDEMRELRRKAGPLGTEGTAWDVAWAALFLASGEARWITGVTLPVDAGVLAVSPITMAPHMQEGSP